MTRKRLLIAVASVAAVVAGAGIWAANRASKTSPGAVLHAGDEVYAVAPELVSELVYDGGGRKLRARRSGSEALFDLQVFDGKGQPLERCRAGTAFSRAMATLLSISVKRPLPDLDGAALAASRANELATLRIADATALDPQEFRVLVVALGGPVVLFSGPLAFESSVPSTTIEQLQQGCAALGTQKSP